MSRAHYLVDSAVGSEARASTPDALIHWCAIDGGFQKPVWEHVARKPDDVRCHEICASSVALRSTAALGPSYMRDTPVILSVLLYPHCPDAHDLATQYCPRYRYVA